MIHPTDENGDRFEAIIQEFGRQRNPEQAAPMARYMQNRFIFLGLKRPQRDLLQKQFLRSVRRDRSINWNFVDKCWDLPEREYQYLAMDYLLAQLKYLKAEDMLRLEKLLTIRAWWDTVDLIAVRLAGSLCSRFPDLVREFIFKWSGSQDLWLRRSAILFQLKYKQDTDADLLGQIIEQNSDGGEFFIDKAIGWALREYSKTDPDWVRSFIGQHHLSPLSVREGSKYI